MSCGTPRDILDRTSVGIMEELPVELERFPVEHLEELALEPHVVPNDNLG